MTVYERNGELRSSQICKFYFSLVRSFFHFRLLDLGSRFLDDLDHVEERNAGRPKPSRFHSLPRRVLRIIAIHVVAGVFREILLRSTSGGLHVLSESRDGVTSTEVDDDHQTNDEQYNPMPDCKGFGFEKLVGTLGDFLSLLLHFKIHFVVCVMSREFYKLEQHSDLWMTNYYLAVSFSCSSIYSSTSASMSRQRSSSFSFISSSKVRSSIRLLQFIRKSRQGDRGWFVRRKYAWFGPY